MTLSCFILGEGPLAVRCLQILIERRQAVTGVVASDDAFAAEAIRHGVRMYPATVDLHEVLGSQAFDFLFSIMWRSVLPPSVLALPRHLPVNFHDSPLPKFAGTHATSWALLTQADDYAVTWHVMSKRVDAGDILKQRPVALTRQDTTRSLDLKCLEAGVESFRELIGELETGTQTRRAQASKDRTYFPSHRRPAHDAVIDWQDSAQAIDALCRALAYGPNRLNDLAVPKIYTGSGFLVVKSHRVRASANAVPGTIVASYPGSLTVAASSGVIEISEVSTIFGEPLNLEKIISAHGWTPGQRLPGIHAIVPQLAAAQQKYAKTEGFWYQQLAGLQPLELPVPTICTREEKMPKWTRLHIDGRRVTALLNAHAMAGDDADLIAAAFIGFLARLARQRRFHVAYHHQALGSELARLAGLYASHVPLVVDLPTSAKCADAMRAIVDSMAATRMQGTYLNDLIARSAECQGAVDAFDVCVATAVPAVDASGVLRLVANAERGECVIEFDRRAIQPAFAKAVQRAFDHFLEILASSAQAPLDTIDVLTGAERQRILVNWNENDDPDVPDRCVHQLIEARALRVPQRTAVVCGDTTLSYQVLNEKANGLAAMLRSRGVGAGDYVAVLLAPGIDLLIAYLAIMKAGAAFAPVDPSWPRRRIVQLLGELRSPVVLADTLPEVTALARDTAVMTVDHHFIPRHHDLDVAVDPTDPMYVIYTSGSTGTPKGVINTHRGAVNRFYAASKEWQRLEIAEQLRVLVTSMPTFDPSVRQYLWPLTVGGCTVIPSGQTHFDLDELLDAIARGRVTSISLVSSLLQLLADYLQANPGRTDSLNSLRHLYVGGEKVRAGAIRAFRTLCPWVRVAVIYGPTETAMGVISYPVGERDDDPLPIGRPLANVRAYVLDDHLEPVPTGVVGELCIGGVQVGLGYLNDPQATAAAFLPDPHRPAANDRLYRTGDRAYFRDDGQLMFVGRIDDQVKIRGVRIELGDVKAALDEYPDVRESEVLVSHDLPTDPRLVAYLVAHENRALDPTALSDFLERRLPQAYRPTGLVVLDAIPKLPSGKIDRQSLPARDTDRPELATAFTAPRTPTEERLAKVWGDVLGLDQVGVHDDFFNLGGHSLPAIRLFSEIARQFGKRLAVDALFSSPTVAGLARLLDSELQDDAIESIDIRPATNLDQTPLFVISPLGALFLNDLSQIIEKTRPFHVLQPPGLDENQPPLPCVEYIAAYLLGELRRRSPQGPYLLAGRCFGGFVAFEMAQQLIAQGESVAGLFILDSAPPYTADVLPTGAGQRSMSAKVIEAVRARRWGDFVRGARLRVRRVNNRVIDRTRQFKTRFLASPEQRRIDLLERANKIAGLQYRAKPYPGRIVLFRSEEFSKMPQKDAHLHWSALALGGFESRALPGSHLSILREPHVHELAAQIEASISSIPVADSHGRAILATDQLESDQ